jgi:hypothetical protein
VAGATVCAVLAAVGLVLALAWFDMTCDEACGGPEWWRTEDAWQWTAQLAVATLGCAAAAAAVILVVLRRYRVGVGAMVFSAVCFAAFAVFLAPLSSTL